MRALVPALALLLLVAPAGSAVTQNCPASPNACPAKVSLYSKQTFEVGPFTVVVEVTIENGSAEAETVATARPGDAGEVRFSLVAGPEANATYNASIDLQDEVEGLTWLNETERAFEHQPQTGVSRVEAFAFRVDEDARAGIVNATFTLAVDNATHEGAFSVDVKPAATTQGGAAGEATDEGRAESPGPGAALALVAAGLLALALRRARRG